MPCQDCLEEQDEYLERNGGSGGQIICPHEDNDNDMAENGETTSSLVKSGTSIISIQDDIDITFVPTIIEKDISDDNNKETGKSSSSNNKKRKLNINARMSTSNLKPTTKFKCSKCGMINGPPGGCPPKYHDAGCTVRKRYEREQAIERFKAGPTTLEQCSFNKLKVYTDRLKFGRALDILIMGNDIKEDLLTYKQIEALQLYRKLNL